MTFCLGIKTKQGLIALADTQISKGSERLTKGKLSMHPHGNDTIFLMTSGLRSIRDKAAIYFDEQLSAGNLQLNRLYQAANLLGQCLRQVANEDRDALSAGGLNFNLHAILGGRLSADQKPAMYLIYPEGNWIEMTDNEPYFVIGRSAYGKPILDRLLTSETSLQQALALGFLAFDATRTSATDVDYPLDMLVFRDDSAECVMRRFDKHHLQPLSAQWQQKLEQALNEFPEHWADQLLEPANHPEDSPITLNPL